MKIAIIGYGNQGRAQALNLKDSGLTVKVGLRDNSKSTEKVINDNLKSLNIKEAIKWADIISILLPDKVAPKVFREEFDSELISNKNNLVPSFPIIPKKKNYEIVGLFFWKKSERPSKNLV